MSPSPSFPPTIPATGFSASTVSVNLIACFASTEVLDTSGLRELAAVGSCTVSVEGFPTNCIIACSAVFVGNFSVALGNIWPMGFGAIDPAGFGALCSIGFGGTSSVTVESGWLVDTAAGFDVVCSTDVGFAWSGSVAF